MSLLPCPFCGCAKIKQAKVGGSDERVGYNFTVTTSCEGCFATIARGSRHDKNGWCNEAAVDATVRCTTAWNTRII